MPATETVTVAQTILRQLGGNKFIAMTGAKNLLATDKGLQCKIGTGATDGITHLRIDLVNDLYTMTFLKGRGTSSKTIATVEKTGMHPSLGTMGRYPFGARPAPRATQAAILRPVRVWRHLSPEADKATATDHRPASRPGAPSA